MQTEVGTWDECGWKFGKTVMVGIEVRFYVGKPGLKHVSFFEKHRPKSSLVAVNFKMLCLLTNIRYYLQSRNERP